MSCSGSPPTFNGSPALVSSNCVNSTTALIDVPCGSSGYRIKLYRNQGSSPTYVPAEVLYDGPSPTGPQSAYPYPWTDTPPCVRGVYYYGWTIECDGVIKSASSVSSAISGGPAEITFSDVSADDQCIVTTRAQITKPCGECAGTIKCFRKAGSPVTFDGSEVIYTAAVPAGPLVGEQYSTTDTPGDGIFYYAWRVYADTGNVDDEYNPGSIENNCNIYNPYTTELPVDQIEKQIVLVRVTKVGGYYIYTDDRMLGLKEQRIEWWYHKNGGCGAFRFLTHETFDDLRSDLDVSWEIHVRIKMGGETRHTTWFRGVVRSISTEEQGAEQFTEIRGYGYVELLDNVIIQHKYPAGMTVKQMVDDIIDVYVEPSTRIRRPREVDLTNGDSGVDSSPYVTQSEVHFECSALKALKFLAELQGNREFGVDAQGAIYFRTNVTTVSKNFYLAQDIVRRVAGGKTFIQGNDIKVSGKAFGAVNYLQNRADVTDITLNGLYENATEVPWLTGDQDASAWADNIIAKNKAAQYWEVFTWKNVDENIFATHPVGKIKIYGADVSNDVNTHDIAKIMYVEGGWTTKQEIREIGSPTIQPELDQQLLKATIYAGFYPRDIVEELEVRLREQVEFLKGKQRQYRYPNDVTNLPSRGHIPGELIHLSKDVTNNDVTNNPTEIQDLTNPRGVLAAWLDKQWTKLSTRRTVHSLPARGKFIGEIVSLITDPTFASFGDIYVWDGIAWSTVGSGSSSASAVNEGARVNNSTDIPVSGATTLTFDTILANDNGVFGSVGTSRMTAKTNGWYAVSGSALWGVGINGTYRDLYFLKNGTTIVKKNRRDDFDHNVARTNEVEEVIYLLVGDYIELVANTDAIDGGNTITAVSPYSPMFSMALLTGGGTFSAAGGNPTGPAGGDLYDVTRGYPNPMVTGILDSPLPAKQADGFLKRNLANTAWELDPTYGRIGTELKRSGGSAVRIDQWADPTDITTCDVTNGRHGLYPKPTGEYDEVLFTDGRFDKAYLPTLKETVLHVQYRTTPIFYGGDLVLSNAGSPSNHTDVNNKLWINYATAASLNARAGFDTNTSKYLPIKSVKSLFMNIKTGPAGSDLTSVRMFFVITDFASGEFLGSDDVLMDAFGFRYSTSAGDTNWKCYTNNGSATGALADSGIPVLADTEYRLRVDRIGLTSLKYYINEAFVATISTKVSTLDGGASWWCKSQTLDSTGKNFRFGKYLIKYW